MKMHPKLLAIIKLSRFSEYLIYVIIISLLGLIFSHKQFTPQTVIPLFVLILAQTLAMAFAFMINDIEDAPDDALNPDKMKRNPVSNGTISRTMASTITGAIAVISLCSYALLGFLPFLFGLLIILICFLYSWKKIRLKNIPFIDIIAHALMLSGLLYLSAYSTFTPFVGVKPELILPFLFLLCVSAYGELFNEIRDFTYDKKAGLTHTATLLGKKTATWVMYTFLALCILLLVLGIFLGLFPLWVLISTGVIGALLIGLLYPTLKKKTPIKRQQRIQDLMILAALIAIVMWVATQS